MFRVISLTKTGNADPQEYTLVMKDLEITQKGYLGRTETGTEEAIREALRKGGMPEAEIDVAFQRVESMPQMEDKQKPQMAVASDETGRALYPAFRAMFLEELGKRFESLAEGRETIPVAEVRRLLMVDEAEP